MELFESQTIDFKQIGDLFRANRIKQKMSQEYFANHIGIATSTMERIENGKSKLTLENFILISHLLGLQVTVKHSNANID